MIHKVCFVSIIECGHAVESNVWVLGGQAYMCVLSFCLLGAVITADILSFSGSGKHLICILLNKFTYWSYCGRGSLLTNLYLMV